MTEQAGAQPKLDWPEMYEAGFKVLREEPSIVVAETAHLLGEGKLRDASVLDLGCGELRNTIFLAQQGAHADAIDVHEPADELADLQLGVRQRINFNDMPVQDYPFEPDTFDLIVCTRLLQYLSPADSEKLVGGMAISAKSGGALALNYTVKGGLVGNEDSPTATYSHDPATIRGLLESKDFVMRSFKVQAGISSIRLPGFDNGQANLTACDLIAVKQ